MWRPPKGSVDPCGLWDRAWGPAGVLQRSMVLMAA